MTTNARQNVLKTKPLPRDPQRTRAKILRAAKDLFAKEGPDGASVDDIAAKAGVNKRMLYHYYGSKEGLYLAVLQDIYGRLRRLSSEIFGDARDLRELIDRVVREYFTFLQKNPRFVALLNWENSRQAGGLKQIDVSGLAEPFLAAAHKALRREQKNRSIRDDVDIKYLLMSCLALCSYYFTNRHSLSVVFGIDMEDPVMMDQWIDHVSRLVADGVTADAFVNN